MRKSPRYLYCYAEPMLNCASTDIYFFKDINPGPCSSNLGGQAIIDGRL